MSAPAFSRADVIDAITDGARRHEFFGGRIRALADAGILKAKGRTDGGQARYGDDARVLAVVCNTLLDWGLQHPQRLPESFRANPCRSPFWAVAEALDPMTIDLVLIGVCNGQDWLLRLDRITGQAGETTFLARVYPMTENKDYGPTPEGCLSTLSLGLTPILAHLVEDA